MGVHDVAEDWSELLAALLEALLYGFSLLMFGGTIWTLVFRRSTDRINRKMFAVACALLLFSTTHLVIDFIRVMQGFVLLRDTYPGGTIGYFSNVSHWTFVGKSYVYTVQTLIGDGVVLYRCYVVWQSKLIMVLPMLLYCSVIVTGFACPYIASQAAGNKIYGWWLWKWITSFYASTLATNLLTTLLLACRIWYVDSKGAGLRGRRRSRLRPMLHVILDAGVIYSLTLLIALICFTTRSNAQFVLLNMITPIISITFYMIIIRVGMADRANQSSHVAPRYSVTGTGIVADQRSRMKVHVSTLTQVKYDGSLRSPMTAITDENGRNDSVLDDIRCGV